MITVLKRSNGRGLIVISNSPYRDVLGERYAALHPHVRLAHEAPLAAEGTVDVVHGSHPLTPLIVRAMKLPAAGAAQPVALHVSLEPAGSNGTAPAMGWRRQIGGTRLETRQFVRCGRLVEEMGPGAVEFALRVEADGSLCYERVACRYLRFALPLRMAPLVRAVVSPAPAGWRVDVLVEWRGQLICRYGGLMHPVTLTP